MDQMNKSLNPAGGAGAGAARGAGSTFDNLKETVADKLHTAAGAIQDKVGRGGQASGVSEYGRTAAEWLDRSSDYVRGMDPQQLRTDVENQVRRNPGRSLLIAGAAGLILGAIFRRR